MTHDAPDERPALERQRRQHEETLEHRARDAARHRRAAVDQWRLQRDEEDRRRHEQAEAELARRRIRDEQVRLRHAAEDDERRCRRALDDALRHERVTAHLARSDRAQAGDLVRARADVDRAEVRWREADEVRRQWPSRWPW